MSRYGWWLDWRSSLGLKYRVLVLILAASLAYYLTYFNYGLDLDDEGFLLANASSILEGSWPMADFYSYQPLSYFGLALCFKVLGNGVYTERLMLMTLILLNVALVFVSASKLLPLRWALLPTAIYAVAPGAWYKVFFITHIIVSLAAMLWFIERPSVRRALLVGVTCGIAVVSRIEAAVLIAAIAGGTLYLTAWRSARAEPESALGASHWVLRGAVFEMGFLAGSLAVVLGMLGAYWAAGKLPALIENTAHYYNYFNSIAFVNTLSGRASPFSPVRLYSSPSAEMWSYAIALAACGANLLRYAFALLRHGTDRRIALLGFATAAFGLGSMGYTYFFVWNSRMLSSFAVVYINYFILLFDLYRGIGARFGQPIVARACVAVGIFLIVGYLGKFVKVQNYSGSFTTRIAEMTRVDHPRLRNIVVYADQGRTIADLVRLTRGAGPGDFLIPMSESTTLSYLSGLSNPTYYRLFLGEFANPGEQDRAIAEFERYRVRYFVARRGQFLNGPLVGSDLASYAPKVRAYLVDHYVPEPLGEGFVLLVRK